MSGLSWTVASQVGQQVMQFVIQMALARMLLPEEFGLVAMMSVFLTISNMIAQAGMGSAIVQAKELSETDIRTTFTLNIGMGLFMALVLCLCAPWISLFYREPDLVTLLRVLSVSVFFQQLGGVHSSLLSRDLKYRDMMMATLPALLISGTAGVVSAALGFGVWALVVQSISSSIISSGLLWYRSDWSARFGFSLTSFRSIFPFGWKIAVNQILNSFFNQIYILVIGRFYATSEVAFYQRAKSFQNLAVVNLMSIFNRVAFPLLSRLNADDSTRMREAHYKFLGVIAWVVFPALAVMASLSEPMISMLLTDKWLEAAPYLQVLCLIGIFMVVNIANANFMLAKGDAGLHLKLSIVSKLLVVTVLYFTYKMSIINMLWGQLLTIVIVNFLLLYFLNVRYGISLRRFFIMISGPSLASLAIYIAALSAITNTQLNAFLELCVGGGVGLLVYWCGLFLFRGVFREDIWAVKNTYPKLFQLIRLVRLV